jgi:hypothetical protein
MDRLERLLSNPEEAREAMNRLGEALTNFGHEVAKALVPMVEAFSRAAEQVHEWMWERYRQAGMPYGDNSDGMTRWFNEQAVIYRAEEKAREELAWQQGLVELRERFRHN